MPEDLTLSVAADRYGLNARTLRYAAERGHLRARKVGSFWLTTPAAVERWVSDGKHTPGPPKKEGGKRK